MVKRIIIGSLIQEYALRQLKTYHDLKYRTKIAIGACEKVQSYLVNHPDASAEHRETFRKEFLKDNAVLIGELIELVWDLDSQGLEELIKQLRDVQGVSTRILSGPAGAAEPQPEG